MEDDPQAQIFAVESAFYSNCLLLGYDAAKTGVELARHMFRHSNPKGGEAVLYFLLSCIRPLQFQKDFHGVWPIFDARQARDFRKVVQNLLAELEASKDLPRSNSRLSSLATCCGERFIELVWQLSAHALREVLLRMSDVRQAQVPVPLTEVAQQAEYASALLPITKARIALQRKKFLTSAAAAVERQDEWAGLADEITAEHRALTAEQALLQQQLQAAWLAATGGLASTVNEKVKLTVRAKEVKLATGLWASLMKHTEESQRMTSGHLQDVLTLREHRYRIDGAALREAMQSSDQAQPSDFARRNDPSATGRPEHDTVGHVAGVRKVAAEPLDVVDMLQSWTGALQASQQQLQQGNGVGPIISDGEGSHGQALENALAEHKKHLANLQALVSALKEQTPKSESTVDLLREQVAEAMAESSQAGGPLSEPPFTPGRRPGARLPDERSKSARLQLVPPTPAMKLGGRQPSGKVAPGSLSSLDEAGNDQEDKEANDSEGAKGRSRVGTRMLGSLFESEPGASGNLQNVDELRRSIRHAAAARQEERHVAAAAPMTAGSRNQPFVTPAAALHSFKTPRFGSAVTGSSRPGVVARLDMDRGVPGGRATGQSSARGMPPPRDVTTGRLRNRPVGSAQPHQELGRAGKAQVLRRDENDARKNSSSIALESSGAQAAESFPQQRGGPAWSSADDDVMSERPRSAPFRPAGQPVVSQAEHGFDEDRSSEYSGLDTGLGQGLDDRGFDGSGRRPRESSASRQSVSGWPPERVLSPPLQLEVDMAGDDPDDIFDLLAPLKAQDLNFYSPRGAQQTGRSSPSGP
ncbi:hypothetical protein KFL_003700110 [Klebsormidium nitens]|uniref:HAUS augmin-like complex subunit 6 N-terminal domain-containing protein n=1 Tax=Klebsormidium nitens TaxID=105231 RepID=A0A1Y1IF32_KLENI|nr:hypothetical protein KFL_003700110 [Klebsormidium nitens]|eukprot:GAQ87691.1 hypothetical protein KFL_003700110 [Klebsormidium nitens]